MITQENLHKTPLYDEHLNSKARMVPFGQWAMPLQYDGILSEHEHTRRVVSIFDISHMGEFIIEGDYAASGLDRLVTMSLSDLPVNACRYGCILNERGGVMDDLIIFRMEQEKWFLVVNGATTQKDAQHFKNHLTKQAIFRDVSSQTGKIDVQGPLAREILSSFVAQIGKLDYYTFDFFNLLGERVLISRTGYTGELGYEIYFPWDKTRELWQALSKHPKIRPAGLGARDVLRLEMGYSLYGHELAEDISPLESGLKRFIDFSKDFIGKDMLVNEQKEGPRRRLVGIMSETRRAPRQGHSIFLPSGEEIGVITSGTFSPSINKGIALGFISPNDANGLSDIAFGDDKIKNSATIVNRTFYKDGSLRQ